MHTLVYYYLLIHCITNWISSIYRLFMVRLLIVCLIECPLDHNNIRLSSFYLFFSLCVLLPVILVIGQFLVGFRGTNDLSLLFYLISPWSFNWIQPYWEVVIQIGSLIVILHLWRQSIHFLLLLFCTLLLFWVRHSMVFLSFHCSSYSLISIAWLTTLLIVL
jgi:hypothetical protein